MDQAIRNKLRNAVTQCRKLLEDAVAQVLQGQFGIYATGKKDEVHVDDDVKMKHLSDEDRVYRKDILDHLEHVKALGYKPTDSLAQLVREIAFTHLNRFCAYKMMEARSLIRESVSKGLKSQGFLFYLADHEDDEKRANSGQQDVAYRHFLNWLGGTLSEEIGVLFNPNDSANRLYPPQRILGDVLDLLNDEALADIWTQDETIGWVYQYFTPKELREQVRKESQAPRNSYELAFRNQFFTPRYVVEFLTDNTLGSIWYEMRRGNTKLKYQCRYMVRRPKEIFLGDPLEAAKYLGITAETIDDLPSPVRAAFQGDFTVAVAEKTAGYQQWIGLTIPPDQFETVTGHDGDSHLDRVWDALDNYPDDPMLADPSQILVALNRFSATSSGGPYAVKPFERLWEAFHAAVIANANREDLPQEELFKLPVYIPFRPKKDPRELRILDPACGSGHFLLYCFDLLLTIYEEAYTDEDLGPSLQLDYPTLDALKRDVPRLILANNLHGIDIDLRATQIAALALWLRCQRAYKEMEVKKDRPKITRSNFVCAEPMPGELAMLKEFVGQLEPRLLGQLVEVVFDKMKLAGEAGSLLRIEEEIRTAVASAKQQWEVGPVVVQKTLFDHSEPKPKQNRFNLSGVTDDEFFNEAEAKVVETLRAYAEKATNDQRLQRRLFAEDAVRGFAFVELCHKQFHVVLMNPPFGNPVPTVERLILGSYPTYGGDILTAFISRGTAFAPQGSVGAITSRTAFYLPTFDKWRATTLFGVTNIQLCADLGADVLDDALVEAFVSVIGPDAKALIPSVRANRVPVEEKGNHVLRVTEHMRQNHSHKDAFFPRRTDLCSIPKTPVAYSAARQLRDTYKVGTRLSPSLGSVQQGMSTKNDFRFLRLVFEVPQKSVSRAEWAYIAKGGDYRPLYDDIHLVVMAHDEFAELNAELIHKYPYLKGNTDWVLHPDSEYFIGGITYPERTTSAFGPRLMPDNCYFSHVGLGILPRNDFNRYVLLGWLLSRPVQLQVELQAGSADAVESGSAARHYSKALIESLFLVSPESLSGFEMILRSAVADAALPDLRVETSRLFSSPSRSLSHMESLHEGAALRYEELQAAALRIVVAFDECDNAAEIAFGLNETELLDEEVRRRPCTLPECEPDEKTLQDAMRCSDDALVDLVVDRCGFHRSLSKKCYIADRRLELLSILCGCHPKSINEKMRELRLVPPKEDVTFTQDVMSYLLGCVFGRWDVRMSTSLNVESIQQSQLETIPRFPSGMLLDVDQLPAMIHPSDYPVEVVWSGLLVDESGAADDIVTRVRQMCEYIWGSRVDVIEKEACDILGIKDLREYFRKSGKGGFWDDHVSRYSKSRRKAPIYWLLQSSKRNFAVWLYYHRLDKDLLFKALENYIKPKLQLEANNLDSLRSQKAAAGETGKAAKKIDKDIEKQEDFISELQDFENKLRRAANLHLEPDLNDGVVLNIAPMHELVPWKEAKTYWNELIAGEYEWSSIGKQLREKGLVK